MTDGNDYAFFFDPQWDASSTTTLTKREYFAAMMLQGLMSNPERYKYVTEMMAHKGWSHAQATWHNAKKAVYLAEALIEALNTSGNPATSETKSDDDKGTE